MTRLVSIFASNLLPVFLVAGVGFLLARYREASVKTLAQLVFYALAPCLVFNLLVTSRVDGLQFSQVALFCVAKTLGMGAIAALVAVPLRLDRLTLSGFLLVVMFSNSGNYGLPIVLFAFGRDALSHGTAYFVTSSVLAYTVGAFLAATGRRRLWSALAGVGRVPAVYGSAAALLVLASGWTIPLPIMRPIQLLSDAALPVLMLVLGMQLKLANVSVRRSAVASAVLLSLVVAPFVALGLAAAIGLDGPARQAAVLQASMPSGVVTTILALEFDAAPTFVAAAVFVSTILSPLTLTILIAYLQG